MADILIIDDDEQFRMMLHQLLTSVGHAVTTACDGADGLKRFRADPADLVITDIVMPNKESLETIMALRREFPRLPIVTTSGGQAQSGLWLRVAGMLGAECTLAKPFTLTQLTETIARVLTTRSKPLAQAREISPVVRDEVEAPLT